MVKIIESTKNGINQVTKSDEYGLVVENMLNNLDYFNYLKDDDNGEERVENVKEFIGTIQAFFKNNPNSEFDDFMINATLQASSDEIEDGNYVSLMTVHTAKGLEFDDVFIYKIKIVLVLS